MKKVVGGLIFISAALLVAWMGSIFYVGRQIESSLSNYESLLTESSDLVIYRLEYEAGLLSGQLHYDVQWQPNPASQLGVLLAPMQEQLGVEFRVRGTADVRHGPYVGGSAPFALARMDWEYHLPEEVRNSMPQYPGDTPFVAITGVLGFDGSMQSRLTGVNYEGTVIDNGERVELALAGVSASLNLDAQGESAHLIVGTELIRIAPEIVEVAIEDFNLDVLLEGSAPAMTLNLGLGRLGTESLQGAFRFNLGKMNVQANTTRVQPAVWIGQNTVGLAAFEIEAAGYTFAFRDSNGTTRTALDNAGRLEMVSESFTGSLEVGEHAIHDLRMDVSLRSINVDAYSRMSALGSNVEAAMDDPQEFFEEFLAAVNGLLADHPIISVDRLAFSVLAEEDISLSTSVSCTGEGQLQSPEQAAELVNDVEFDADATLTIAAVRELISMYLRSADPTLPDADLNDLVELTYEEFILNLEDSEMATISADTISTSLRLRNGNYSVNGRVVSTTEELIAAMMAPDDPMPSSSSMPGGGPVEMKPEFLIDPQFERVNLAAGFLPDPHTVKMTAAGQRPVYDVLGADCAGNVNSPKPDVTLSYVAGTEYGLYVYAESVVDTTLIVLTPDGWFCDDDSHGDFNPGVQIGSPTTGDYMIWLGTYETGTAKAVLGISER